MLDRPRGWSLLHLAAALGHAPCVKYLLGCKVPVNGAQIAHGSAWRSAHPYSVTPLFAWNYAMCKEIDSCQMPQLLTRPSYVFMPRSTTRACS